MTLAQMNALRGLTYDELLACAEKLGLERRLLIHQRATRDSLRLAILDHVIEAEVKKLRKRRKRMVV